MGNVDLSTVYFGTAFEAALGTAATLDKRFLLKSGVSPKHEDVVDDNVNGTILDTTVTRTVKKVEGSISGDLNSQIAGLFMKFLMHAKPTTAGAGPYTHTYTDIATGSPETGGIGVNGASFTMLHQVAGIATYIDRFNGCIAKSLTITQTGSGKVQFSLDVAGIGSITTTTEPVGVTLSTEDYFIAKNTAFTVGGTNLASALRGLTLKFTNGMNLLDRAGGTSAQYSAIGREGRFMVELEYAVDEQAVSGNGGHDDYAAETERAIVLTFSGDANKSMAVTIGGAHLVDTYPQKIEGHGIYGVTRKVRGMYATGNTPDFLSVVVTNDVALYT